MKFQDILLTLGLVASLIYTSYCQDDSSPNYSYTEITTPAVPGGYAIAIARLPCQGFGKKIKNITVTDLISGQGHSLTIIKGGVGFKFVKFSLKSDLGKGISVKILLEYYDK